jgi:chitin disaccharide deacetylase
MLIINADDWGRSAPETDLALECFLQRRISSVTAMMFMEDSERGASLAKKHGVPVGLHLNLSQRFYGQTDVRVSKAHERVVNFLAKSKYSVLIYHPLLGRDLKKVYQAQFAEFLRLYGRPPSHIDGHQHKHLCLNVLLGGVIPSGMKVRRSFSFFPGEKSPANRAFRVFVDSLLARRFKITDAFFALSQCFAEKKLNRLFQLATGVNVELMTHPVNPTEHQLLMSNAFRDRLTPSLLGSYHDLI